MLENVKKDYFALTNQEWTTIKGLLRLLRHRRLRFCLVGRLSASENRIVSTVGEFFRKHYEKHYGLEIPFAKMGGGVFFCCIPTT